MPEYSSPLPGSRYVYLFLRVSTLSTKQLGVLVIPAKAGIQRCARVDSCLRRNDNAERLNLQGIKYWSSLIIPVSLHRLMVARIVCKITILGAWMMTICRNIHDIYHGHIGKYVATATGVFLKTSV